MVMVIIYLISQLLTRSAGNGEILGWGNSALVDYPALLCGGWGNGNGEEEGAGMLATLFLMVDMNGLENGIRGLEHGICDGFYEINTGLTGFGN